MVNFVNSNNQVNEFLFASFSCLASEASFCRVNKIMKFQDISVLNRNTYRFVASLVLQHPLMVNFVNQVNEFLFGSIYRVNEIVEFQGMAHFQLNFLLEV